MGNLETAAQAFKYLLIHSLLPGDCGTSPQSASKSLLSIDLILPGKKVPGEDECVSIVFKRDKYK